MESLELGSVLCRVGDCYRFVLSDAPEILKEEGKERNVVFPYVCLAQDKSLSDGCGGYYEMLISFDAVNKGQCLGQPLDWYLCVLTVMGNSVGYFLGCFELPPS